MAERYEITIEFDDVDPDDWADWCDAELDGIESRGANELDETLIVTAESREDAEERVNAILKPGMSIQS